MRGHLLQDWVTLQAGSNVGTITQGADFWVDLGDVEDIVFFLDVREVSSGGSPSMNYQTSPTLLDVNFTTMTSVSMNPTNPTLLTVPALTAVYSNMAPVPPARYVRWQLANIASQNATFRIWMATYAWVKVVA